MADTSLGVPEPEEKFSMAVMTLPLDPAAGDLAAVIALQQAVFEAAPTATVCMDDQGHFHVVNREARRRFGVGLRSISELDDQLGNQIELDRWWSDVEAGRVPGRVLEIAGRQYSAFAWLITTSAVELVALALQPVTDVNGQRAEDSRGFDRAAALAGVGVLEKEVSDLADLAAPAGRLRVSRGLKAMLGIAEDASLGAGWLMARVHEEDRHLLETASARAVDERRSNMMFRVMHANGTWRWVESNALVDGGVGGSAYRLTMTLHDVTDRVSAMTQVEASSRAVQINGRRLSQAVQAGQVGLWELDVPSNTLYVSDELISQMGGEASLWRDWDSFRGQVHPDDRSEWESALVSSVGEDGNTTEQRFRLRDAFGCYRWILARSQVYADDTGARVVAAHLDITEQVEREASLASVNEALQVANQELRDFARVASHDLRAPLRGIAVLAEWIREDGGDDLPAVCHEHIDKLTGRIDRMRTLLDDLLEYSRAANSDEATTLTDIGALLDDCLSVVVPPETFAVSTECDVAEVPVVATPLATCVRNLVDNAVKHHDRPDGQVAVIATMVDPGTLQIVVEDDGPGIDPVYHERIFGVFQTLQSRDVVEGSGMGLSLVKRLAEHWNGSVAVTSALGSGSRFTILWPIEDSQRGPGTDGATSSPPH